MKRLPVFTVAIIAFLKEMSSGLLPERMKFENKISF
jgi:hypothetical protein